MSTFDIKKLCNPAKLYLAIAFFAFLVGLVNGVPVIAIVFKFLFALVWTYVLGFLCKMGLSKLSWFLVLLPYILILLAMFKIYNMPEEHKQYLRMIRLQGAYGQEALSNMDKKKTKEGYMLNKMLN